MPTCPLAVGLARPPTSSRFAAVAVLAALVLCVPVQAQTPEIDELRVRAETGDAEAQAGLGIKYSAGIGVPQDDAEAVRW
jgi:TPR repeat protein